MTGRRVKDVIKERQEAVSVCRSMELRAVDPAFGESKEWTRFRIPDDINHRKMKQFIRRDKMLIRHCDALVVLTGDSVSDGTWHELIYADMMGIPVALVAPERTAKKLVGWSTCLYPCFSSLSKALRYLKRRIVEDGN
jgi:nucleoside 2-deoxyribosyltransferase